MAVATAALDIPKYLTSSSEGCQGHPLSVMAKKADTELPRLNESDS